MKAPLCLILGLLISILWPIVGVWLQDRGCRPLLILLVLLMECLLGIGMVGYGLFLLAHLGPPAWLRYYAPSPIPLL